MKTLKTSVRFMLGLMILGAVFCFGGEAMAAKKTVTANKEVTVRETIFSSFSGIRSGWKIEGTTKKSVVENLVIENKKVGKTNVLAADGAVWVTVVPKKPGVINAAFDVKTGKKTVSYKYILTIRRYKNPFKSIMLGKEDQTAQFDGSSDIFLKDAVKNKKLQLELKAGYKLESIGVWNQKTDKWNTFKNGSKVTVKKNDVILINLSNKKKDNLCATIRLDKQ